MITVNFVVNNEKIRTTVADNIRLLDILRDELGLTGTKEGCGIGECGACTVIMNKQAVNSCLILATHLQNAEIETIENIDKDEILNRLKEAFLDNGAIQCGFCTPGMLMSAKALLDKNPNPTINEIKTALEGNLCRCTGYAPIIQSILEVIKKGV